MNTVKRNRTSEIAVMKQCFRGLISLFAGMSLAVPMIGLSFAVDLLIGLWGEKQAQKGYAGNTIP